MMKKEKTTKTEIEDEKTNLINNNNNNNNNKDSKEEKPRKDFTKPIVLTIFIILIIGTSWMMFTSYNNSFAEEQCLAIQNHPELNYPCVCYPSEKPTDLDPFVDENTEKYCRCDCDIGNNETYTAWIIRAKE